MPFLYSGEYQDAPGRQYLRARYYDANVGRFLTEDTYRGDTANPGSLNLYTYVANNPLSYADPSGHIPEWVNETIDAVNPLSDIMTLADPCASMFDKGLAVVSIAANFFPEAKPLTIAAKEARAAKRVAKILERSVKGAGKEDPYDLLKQFGIPSTLSKEEIHAANAVDLQMMYKGPGKTLLSNEGNVGTFKQLAKQGAAFDNITPHHMPSAAKMKQAGVKRSDGVSMNMEQPHPGTGGRHRETYTYGLTGDKLDEYLNLSYRDTLAHDIMDVRNIYMKDGLYTSEIRQGLQDVIQMNKNLFPGLFNK